jgi:hypothetical protein
MTEPRRTEEIDAISKEIKSIPVRFYDLVLRPVSVAYIDCAMIISSWVEPLA